MSETDEEIWLRNTNPEMVINCCICKDVVGEASTPCSADMFTYLKLIQISCKECAKTACFESMENC